MYAANMKTMSLRETRSSEASRKLEFCGELVSMRRYPVLGVVSTCRGDWPSYEIAADWPIFRCYRSEPFINATHLGSLWVLQEVGNNYASARGMVVAV